MTSTPSHDYVQACKLIDTFGCFFEKIANGSTNSSSHLNKLSKFKDFLYQNLSVPDRLLAQVEPFCGKPLETNKSVSPMISQFQVESPEKHRRAESYPATQPQTTSRSKSSMNSLTQTPSTKVQSKQVAGQEGSNDTFTDRTSFNTEFLPMTSFLTQVKAASHPDMNKILSMTSTYSSMRSFKDPIQSIFTALCFTFAERLLNEKVKDAQNPLSQSSIPRTNSGDLDILDFKDSFEFLSFIRSCNQTMSESDLYKKFYDAILTNPKLFQSVASVFKQYSCKGDCWRIP